MIYSLLSLVAVAMFSCDASLVRRLQQAPPQLPGLAGGAQPVVPGAGGAGFVAPGVPGLGGVGAGNGAVIPGPGFNPYYNGGLAPQIDIIPQGNGGFLIDVIPQGNYNPPTKVDDM